MIYTVRQAIPKRLRVPAARFYRSVSVRAEAIGRKLDRRILTPGEFEGLLVELGVTPGATVVVHSSMDEIARRVPGMTPVRLVNLLQELLGSEGTLLMATFPFLGRQHDYLESHRSFDPRRTPSQVGLVTEIFRRMPGVIRSLHPTHSVAAWGKYAQDLTATHHLGTAFGENSPLYKIQQVRGLVIGLGARLPRFSIMHVPEELHPKMRQHIFEATPITVTIVDGSTEIPYRLSVMRPDVDRNYDRVERHLLEDGALTYIERSGLKCAVGHSEKLIARSLDLIDRNIYLFHC